MQAYQTDLAYVHDDGFTHFAKQSAPVLLDILRRNGITAGSVVDLGCGSGVWAEQLINAGYEVVGVDISESMIDLARQRVPDGMFHVDSFVRCKLPQCNAVTALGEVLNYQFDKRNTWDTLTRLFKRVYKVLQPGGVFIFDIAEPGRGSGPQQRFWEGKDWIVLVEVEHSDHPPQLTRRIVTLRRVGEQYRRHDETHHLNLYRGAEVASFLRDIGFRVRLVRSYGEYRFPRAWVGVVARKPHER